MATATAAPPKQRTFAQQVSDLLAALYDGLAPRGRAWAKAGRGSAATTFSWPPYAPHDIWPPPLLRELRYEIPDDVRLCPATLDEQGARLRDTRVVWSEIPLPPNFDGVGSRGWYVTQETESAAMARVEAFPLAPSFIVDQAWSLFVGFLLSDPAPLDSPATLHRIESVQRALADALGGLTEPVSEAVPRRQPLRKGEPTPVETVPGWHPARYALRVPASRNHDHGREGGRVLLKQLEESRRYALEEIEDALKAGATGGRK